MAARRFFRIFIYFLLAIYIVAGLAFAALKFWLLPAIDHWNAPLTHRLSQALGASVQVGEITAKWRGALPELELKDVAIYDSEGKAIFTAPSVYGRLRLSSLWHLEPHFARLDVQGLEIHLVRNEQGQFGLFERALTEQQESTAALANFSFYHWLGQQGQLRISQSQLQFTDQLKSASPLVLDIVALQMQQAQGVLAVGGDLRSLKHAHTRVRFQSQWLLPHEHERAQVAADELLDGQLRLEIAGLQPSAWREWVDIPSFLYQGTMDAQIAARVQNQRLEQVRGDLVVDRPLWIDATQLLTTESKAFFQAQKAHFHFELSAEALAVLAELSADDPVPTYVPGALWRLQAEDLYVHVPQEFDAPLYLQEAGLHIQSRSADQAPIWDIEQVHLDSGTGLLQFHGTVAIDDEDLWQTKVDIAGVGQQIQLNSIYQYVPYSLDVDLRNWLQTGLPAGEISNLRFEWSGLLDDFEYYQERDDGFFRLQAELRDAVVDYYPPDEEDKGWPAIAQLEALLRWENNHLQIRAQEPSVLRMGASGEQVQVHELAAHIKDLYERADLTVQAHSSGAAKDYYHLWTQWDLGDVLANTVPVTQMTGALTVPLILEVPLGVPLEEMEDSVQVQGAVHFGPDSGVQLWPELPEFSALSGVLGFSDQGATFRQVRGQWLGGPVQVEGALGQAHERLDIEARIDTRALSEFYAHPALQALSGDFVIQAELSIDEQEHVHLQAHSSLAGMGIDLPAPAGKKEDLARPLTIQWQSMDADAQHNYLFMEMADVATVKAVFNVTDASIESLALTTNDEPIELEPELLWADIHRDHLDLDAWWDWYEKVIDQSPESDWQWPAQSKLRIKADQVQVLGFGLQYFTYTHQLAAPGRWRADVSSDQIAGTIFWDRPLAASNGAGHVQANFQRFDVLAQFLFDEEQSPQLDDQAEPIIRKHITAPSAATENAHEHSSAARVRPSKDGLFTEQQMPANKAQALPAMPQEVSEPPFEHLPVLTLKVDKFNVRGYDLGKLHLHALPLERALGWEISEFTLTAADAMHSQGQGQWQFWGAEPGLRLEWESEFSDLGSYAHYVGLDDLIAGGRGSLKAHFNWPYLPWRSDLYWLSGAAQLAWQNGRLQPIKSHSAKLLELLSLQSLSRIARLDLDIGSAFKEGFPFHSITGTIDLDKHWASTSDYEVLSPVGTLLFEGRTNIQSEVIDARARVIPEVDVSGAALAAGMAVNPMVGFGALIAQWILKHPLADAMTIQYQLSGDWDDVSITEIPVIREEGPAEVPTEAQ